jgi:hypothetical protein
MALADILAQQANPILPSGPKVPVVPASYRIFHPSKIRQHLQKHQSDIYSNDGFYADPGGKYAGQYRMPFKLVGGKKKIVNEYHSLSTTGKMLVPYTSSQTRAVSVRTL